MVSVKPVMNVLILWIKMFKYYFSIAAVRCSKNDYFKVFRQFL